MIERYSTAEMASLWSELAKYQSWLNVERAVMEEQVDRGMVPEEALAALKRAKPSEERIREIELEVKHDVLAFTTCLSEQMGEMGRYLHYGLTSSDVVDTALSLRLSVSMRFLKGALHRILESSWTLAEKWRSLPCMGRTHGMHAEPTSFGLRFLGFFAEGIRIWDRLEHFTSHHLVGKISGAVGAYGVLDPGFEEAALARMKLKPEWVSTQVVPRDRIAEVGSLLLFISMFLERVAVELRHLQRTEVGEVEEGFSKGQKGSSAMPHKRNPISAENLTGCARLLRGYALPLFENGALWHERDISHSSVERVALADGLTLAHYALERLARLLQELVVKPDRVTENIEQSGRVYASGRVLLHLVDRGMSREEAYIGIQAAAHLVLGMRSDSKMDFFAALDSQGILAPLGISADNLREQYAPQVYLSRVEEVFERMGREAEQRQIYVSYQQRNSAPETH